MNNSYYTNVANALQACKPQDTIGILPPILRVIADDLRQKDDLSRYPKQQS